jgi:hypothetical protein
MDDMKLERNLRGIGKACFVTYYELFRDKSRIDDLFVVDFLMTHATYKNKHYTEAGAKIRVGFAKGIFNAQREKDALKSCAQARIDEKLAHKARVLLNECNH